jgi:hypothetical protein
MSEPGQSIKLHTEKDQSFRTVHADGAWGMANTSGNIILNFFIDHPMLPSMVEFKYENGFISMDDHYALVPNKGAEAVGVREYQSAVILSVAAAQQVYSVLGNFIKIAEGIEGAQAPK